jgi:hypothetical protein
MRADKTIRVHRAKATLFAQIHLVGPGLKLVMGHDLLVWSESGIICEVSFHGDTQVSVNLDVAVADATEIVSPAKR